MTTSTESSDPPTVLIVDDESDLADLYAAWLERDYQVRTAYDGESALEQYDETVDVVLLDRRMPGLSGDDVLAEIRDRESDSQVVMVTAVDPDFDVLDMGFDGYVTKPVDRDDLTSVVDRMLARRGYNDRIQAYYRLVAKRAMLEAEKTPEELASNDEFAALEQRISDLEAEIDTAVAEFDDTAFEAAFRDLNDS